MTSFVGSNVQIPWTVNVGLSPPEDRVCTHAYVIPLVLSGSFAILLKVASVKTWL